MEQNLLQTNIAYLKGVGPKKAEVLKKELGVATYQDMLNQFPFRYIDRSRNRATVPENKDLMVISQAILEKSLHNQPVFRKFGNFAKNI